MKKFILSSFNSKEEVKKYPRDILTIFKAEKIPDNVNDVLDKFSLELGYDIKKELAKEFIDKQKEILLVNIIDIAKIFDLDEDFITNTIDSEYKTIKIDDNSFDYLISIVEKNLEDFIDNVNNERTNKKELENNEIDEEYERIRKKTSLINTLLLHKSKNVNNKNELKEIAKYKKINITKIKNNIIDILKLYQYKVKEIEKYIIWKNTYLNSSHYSDIPNDYQDMLIYSSEQNKVQSAEFKNHLSKVLNLYFKINSLLEILNNNNNNNNIDYLLIFLIYKRINVFTNINIKKEFLETNILYAKISEKTYYILIESFLFKNTKIENIELEKSTKSKIYQIIISKENLFLWEDKIKYEKLFNYIIEQDEEKLKKIEFFLNKYFKKEYIEEDLLFIFENNLEELELITKQDNVENIYKLKKLYEKWIEINKLSYTKNFIYIYELFNTEKINLELFYELINDDNNHNRYLSFRNNLLSLEKYLIYFKEDDSEYIALRKAKLQTFEEYKNNNYKFDIDFKDIEEKTKKIDNILWEDNILDYIDDYKILLEKISIIKTKTKDKKEQKKEKDEKNNFIKDYFKKYSEDEINLISKILRKIKISSNNTFDSLKANINIIIKYKTLAEEKIEDENFNPEFLKDISSYLNEEKQEEFYRLEFERLWIDEKTISVFLTSTNSTIYLNLILNILNKDYWNENLKEISDLFVSYKYSEKKLKSILNTLNLIKKYNFNFEDIYEIIFNTSEDTEFNYNDYNEKLEFIRNETSKYKTGNWNTDIRILVLKYLKLEINKEDFLENIWEFEEKNITLNNSFDKKVFKSIQDKNNEESEHLAENIEDFFDNFFEKFHSSHTSSTKNNFWIWSWSYTRRLNTILKTLKQWNNEKSIDYLNRIKIINFKFFYSDDIDITNNRINNIIWKAKNIELPFYEALESFWENVIWNINIHWKEDLTKLKSYYSEVFQKYKYILN